ncbi:MAG: nicotinamide mononucleotide transporter, partial [Muribaculaceae bacterium]|nr:nicotinamide mononucleotide transporter [Muribaculaceae bacterium]
MGWLNDLITQTDWVRVTDVAGLVLGLLYLWLEFKASIWLWLVSVIMPIVHGYTYFARGLYADFGMEAYYVLVAIYGFIIWKFGAKQVAGDKKKEKPITHQP